jgi:hypothetical protein
VGLFENLFAGEGKFIGHAMLVGGPRLEAIARRLSQLLGHPLQRLLEFCED